MSVSIGSSECNFGMNNPASIKNYNTVICYYYHIYIYTTLIIIQQCNATVVKTDANLEICYKYMTFALYDVPLISSGSRSVEISYLMHSSISICYINCWGETNILSTCSSQLTTLNRQPS